METRHEPVARRGSFLQKRRHIMADIKGGKGKAWPAQQKGWKN